MRLKSSALKVSAQNLPYTKKTYKKEDRKTNQSQISIQFSNLKKFLGLILDWSSVWMCDMKRR